MAQRISALNKKRRRDKAKAYKTGDSPAKVKTSVKRSRRDLFKKAYKSH